MGCQNTESWYVNYLKTLTWIFLGMQSFLKAFSSISALKKIPKWQGHPRCKSHRILERSSARRIFELHGDTAVVSLRLSDMYKWANGDASSLGPFAHLPWETSSTRKATAHPVWQCWQEASQATRRPSTLVWLGWGRTMAWSQCEGH